MKKNLMTILFFLLSRAAQKLAVNKSHYTDAVHLKVNLFYVRLIKTSRLLFLSSLGMGVCLVFLLSSIVLFHVTFFFYAPYTAETKMWVGFLFAGIYLFVALKAFSYVFDEQKWLDMFHAQHILKKVSEPSPQEKTTSKPN